MLPPFAWVTINCYINRKVVIFPILNDAPEQVLNRGPLVPFSPALPSELTASEKFSLSFICKLYVCYSEMCKRVAHMKVRISIVYAYMEKIKTLIASS